MTDTDALTAYLRQLERIKDDWDDRNTRKSKKTVFYRFGSSAAVCRRPSRTFTRSSSAQSTNLHT